MVEHVSGKGPVSPEDRNMYEQEYKHSADLFQKALDQYSKSDNMFQKEEFKDVMDRSLNILNEAAAGLIRKDLMEQNQKISQDYENFQKSPGDPDTVDKLKGDLDKAKRSVE